MARRKGTSRAQDRYVSPEPAQDVLEALLRMPAIQINHEIEHTYQMLEASASLGEISSPDDQNITDRRIAYIRACRKTLKNLNRQGA